MCESCTCKSGFFFNHSYSSVHRQNAHTVTSQHTVISLLVPHDTGVDYSIDDDGCGDVDSGGSGAGYDELTVLSLPLCPISWSRT